MTIDEKIGKIIRMRRLELGLSQDGLGQRIGVTFQQVQKYEQGVNALNVTRLIDMSKALKMPVTAFFADVPTPEKMNASERETLELIKAFGAIKDYQIRKRFCDLLRVMHS